MSTDSSLLKAPAAPKVSRFRGRYWPVAAILVVCIAGAVFLRYLLAAGEIDRGTANGCTDLVCVAGVIFLGLWMFFLSPFTRRTRWWCIAVPTVVIAVLATVLKIEKADGNLLLYFTWRWSVKPDEVLAKHMLSASRRSVDLSPTEHNYSGFLGAGRDAFVPDVKLATDWKSQPPKLLWKQPIGGGYSAFAVQGNAAITLEQRGEEELVTGYDLRTGELCWDHAIKARHHDMIGGDGPCSTPTIDGGRVYALGATGVLRCLDAATGREIWMRNVLADVGTTDEKDHAAVPWGRSASPLIVDELVVVPGGGPPGGPMVSLIAYNKQTGEKVWTGGTRQISYSSPSLANYGGVRQIVIVNEDNITGHDPKTGDVLWETKWEGSSKATASCSQTVPFGDDRFFVSKGYSGGAAAFQVTRNADGTWETKQLWRNHRVLKTKLDNVIIKNGYVYGLSDGILECVDANTGQRQWEGEDYGHGQVLRVGDVLLVTQEWGAVALVALDPTAYKELAHFQAIEGKTWNNPALVGDLLLVRNDQEAACYKLPLAEK
jgi:outer membrane protein assembly factor BamB